MRNEFKRLSLKHEARCCHDCDGRRTREKRRLDNRGARQILKRALRREVEAARV